VDWSRACILHVIPAVELMDYVKYNLEVHKVLQRTRQSDGHRQTLASATLHLGLVTHAGTHARTHARTHTHTHTHNRFTALWILSGTTRCEPVPEETCIHSHLVINRLLSASSIYYDPWHPPCSIHAPDNLFHNLYPSFLWSTSWLDTLRFICLLHTFIHQVTQAHTITACFAVVPRLCHLILISLKPGFTSNSIM